jgi:hypothetical protein
LGQSGSPDNPHALSVSHALLSIPGLPDGLFSFQKSQFGHILEGLGIKMLVYFMAVWHMLCSLGTFFPV